MSESTMTGLGWRVQFLREKLAGAAAGVPWPLFWDEVSHRRELAWQSPPIRLVEDDGELHRIEVAGTDYWFPREVTPHMLEGLYKLTYYEPHPHHFECGTCRIKEGDVVIDGGSFEGFFTRFALERGARVIAVEPWEPMAEALRRNFAAEIQAGRVIVAPVILSGQPGNARLVIDPAYPIAASVFNEEAPGLLSQAVVATTVDELVASTPWGRCDFVKMDIEGSEREAVAGARETILRDHPRFSIAVYHAPMTYCEIRDDLKGLGAGYAVRGKGVVFGLDGIWRPLMLHAWPTAQ